MLKVIELFAGLGTQHQALVNYTNFLGYTRDENHNFVIVPEQAQVVQRIFNEFLFGYSISEIARRLKKDGCKTGTGKTCWNYNSVYRILTNEKYYGCALMGKTFKPDVLSKKRYKNEGQVESYLLENAFEGIIDKAQFDMVQIELERRKDIGKGGDKTFGKFSSKHTFSKIIRCGCCGSFYTRCYNMRNKGERIASWWCNSQRNGDHNCSQKGISEEAIKNAFVNVLNGLVGNFQDIKAVLINSIGSVIANDPKDKLTELDGKIDTLQNQMLELHKAKTNGKISVEEYGRKGSKIAQLIDDTKKEKESIESSYAHATYTSRRVDEIISVLEGLEPTEEFNEEIFKRLVESITITDRTHLKFKFKVGIEREIDAEIK